MAEQEDFEIDAQVKGGSKKKMILIISAVLLLLIGSGAAAYFMGLFSAEEEATDTVAEEQAEPQKPAIYQSFDAPLVVNFEQRSPVKFLQVDLEVMARDEASIDAFTLHRPMIRNNLLLLLARQDYQEISTPEGKEKLRAEITAEINKIMKERGSEQGIEQVFFTKFVMQ